MRQKVRITREGMWNGMEARIVRGPRNGSPYFQVSPFSPGYGFLTPAPLPLLPTEFEVIA